MIKDNVQAILRELEKGNCFKERVTLVAATKTRTPEEINEAIAAGITDVGENKVQEFTAKYDKIAGANRHFIGRLQTNKVKYLIGKTQLIHSIDRDALATEVALRSVTAGVVSDILLEINLGEESKGGYPLPEGYDAYLRLKKLQGVRIRGFMAMLPPSGERNTLIALCDKMRALYERAKENDTNICYLSMGMSGDYRLCLSRGANMIRLGTVLFGERDYN